MVFYQGVEKHCGVGIRFWKRTEDAASLLDVSVDCHSALAKPSSRWRWQQLWPNFASESWLASGRSPKVLYLDIYVFRTGYVSCCTEAVWNNIIQYNYYSSHTSLWGVSPKLCFCLPYFVLCSPPFLAQNCSTSVSPMGIQRYALTLYFDVHWYRYITNECIAVSY